MYRLLLLPSLLAAAWMSAAFAQPATVTGPFAADARIRTLVYNENDVYTITTIFGYQSNIEFGPKEDIETISLGDRIGWQIIPSGRRLFIRAMAENIRTNMTVVTNQRAYQFDLRAANPGSAKPEELVYVARFFYPEEESKPKTNAAGKVMEALPVAVAPEALTGGSRLAGYNLDYTYTGPEDAAPLKIFDDGSTTYFKLRDASAATVSAVKPDGSEERLATRMADGYLIVGVVAPRLVLRQGSTVICVFNEAPGR